LVKGLSGKNKMPTIKNGDRWADYVRNIFIRSLEYYQRVVMEKFLPSLHEEKINEEAERVEREAFKHMGHSVSPEDCDPGDFVEAARDEAIEFWGFMGDTRQGLINGFAATLYHLFEQQLCEFYRLIA
jgi:hypothetical protein